jgi:hypothetical protein
MVSWNSAHKIALHGFACWTSIAAQVLDGPPGFTTRRLSSFLLIPVGINRQGFAFWPRIFRSAQEQSPSPIALSAMAVACSSSSGRASSPRLRSITKMRFITKTAMFVAKH